MVTRFSQRRKEMQDRCQPSFLLILSGYMGNLSRHHLTLVNDMPLGSLWEQKRWEGPKTGDSNHHSALTSLQAWVLPHLRATFQYLTDLVWDFLLIQDSVCCSIEPHHLHESVMISSEGAMLKGAHPPWSESELGGGCLSAPAPWLLPLVGMGSQNPTLESSHGAY